MGCSPVWFFDLDNTLHDASWRIFAKFDETINDFIGRRLQLAPGEADRLRQHYWLRYGATLSGLVRHHGISVAEYLADTHDFIVKDEPSAWIRGELRLARSLRSLPGRKILLTNAPSRYAARVLGALGIAHLFERTIAIEDMRRHGPMRAKPSRFLLQTLAAEEGLLGRRAILVEDTLLNLKAARAVGWRTVHVACFANNALKPAISRPSYVDLQVKSISELARRARLVYADAY